MGELRKCFSYHHSFVLSVNSAPSELKSASMISTHAHNYGSRGANSRRICTSAKHALNPFRMRTSKTKHLKPFRIRTYEKKGRGPTYRCGTANRGCLLPLRVGNHAADLQIGIIESSAVCPCSFRWNGINRLEKVPTGEDSKCLSLNPRKI